MEDEEICITKKFKLANRVIREKWSTEEKSLVVHHFSDHIKTKRAPKQAEVMDFVALHPNFAKKKWTSIKAVVFNTYTGKLKNF